jgi:hypothetical protein
MIWKIVSYAKILFTWKTRIFFSFRKASTTIQTVFFKEVAETACWGLVNIP